MTKNSNLPIPFFVIISGFFHLYSRRFAIIFIFINFSTFASEVGWGSMIYTTLMDIFMPLLLIVGGFLFLFKQRGSIGLIKWGLIIQVVFSLFSIIFSWINYFVLPTFNDLNSQSYGIVPVISRDCITYIFLFLNLGVLYLITRKNLRGN